MLTLNHFPSKPASRRIALIGELPGKSEVNWHTCPVCSSGYDFGGHCLKCRQGGSYEALTPQPTPLVGAPGKLLNSLLDDVGIARASCFVGNVIQARPPGDNPYAFKWGSEEVRSGLAQLKADLEQFKPHMIYCLGSLPLRAFRGEPGGIKEWRGSLFMTHASSPYPGVKCLSTYHPSAILRDWALRGISRFDYRRLAREMTHDELILPKRKLEVELSCEELIERMMEIRANRTLVTCDSEGYYDFMSCIGFAKGPLEAFVLPLMRVDGTSWWSEEEEVRLMVELAALLEDPEVPKVFQNAQWDLSLLAWSYGIVVRGLQDDTMFKHWEAFPEFEKRLGFMASHLTRQPYYKFQRVKAKEMELDGEGNEMEVEEI